MTFTHEILMFWYGIWKKGTDCIDIIVLNGANVKICSWCNGTWRKSDPVMEDAKDISGTVVGRVLQGYNLGKTRWCERAWLVGSPTVVQDARTTGGNQSK